MNTYKLEGSHCGLSRNQFWEHSHSQGKLRDEGKIQLRLVAALHWRKAIIVTPGKGSVKARESRSLIFDGTTVLGSNSESDLMSDAYLGSIPVASLSAGK